MEAQSCSANMDAICLGEMLQIEIAKTNIKYINYLVLLPSHKEASLLDDKSQVFFSSLFFLVHVKAL